ncbi:MAG: phosphatase PAP2 family protein [Phycisphaerales bacterium]
MAIALSWDRAAYLHVAVHDAAALAKLESSDWYRTLRIIGAPYIWVFAAVVFILVDAPRSRRTSIGVAEAAAGSSAPEGGYFTGPHPALRRATFLLLSSLVSGGLAEVLKACVGRLKPDVSDGWYRFASLRERFVGFHWNDLGFVSSHAATAFGACFALCIMLPRGTAVFMLMATGCAATRLLAGAHYLSDTFGAVLLAYVVVRVMYVIDRRNNAGVAIDRR